MPLRLRAQHFRHGAGLAQVLVDRVAKGGFGPVLVEQPHQVVFVEVLLAAKLAPLLIIHE